MEIAEKSCANEIEVICRDFLDIDRQAECLTDYGQKYQQLSCGKFFGQFRTAILDSKLGLYFEEINQIIHQTGAVPPDHYSLVMLMNEKGRCKINGQPFYDHSLWFAGPGSSYNAITVAGTQFAVIDVEKNFFEAILAECYPECKNNLMNHKFGIFLNSPTNTQWLRRAIGQILFILETSSHCTSNSLTTKRLRMSIAEMMTEELYNALHPQPERKAISLSSRYQITKCAYDYINDRRAIDISISDLCRRTGVSRRTIEYSFQDCIGQSPVAFIRSIKLNEIRRALLSPENAHKSIGDIVAQWGIWHLSRFAQYYQNQFNELPSETRNQI